MPDRHPSRIWVRRPPLSIASALTLALIALGGLLLFSARTATTALLDKVLVPASPLCFFQDGYLNCVERAVPHGAPVSDDVSPEALLLVLLAGPTAEESAQGIETAFPTGTHLAGLETRRTAITVRLAFPDGFLSSSQEAGPAEAVVDGPSNMPFSLTPLVAEGIVDQIFHTLLPLGYRDLRVEVQAPSAPGSFRPLSSFLPPIDIPSKGGSAARPDPDGEAHTPRPASQPPVEVLGRPQGALSGKTIYVSAGHGWQWNGYDWRTQRPAYPDASTGYVGPIIEDHNNAEVVNQYLIRYLWNAGADVWTVRERDMHRFEQVIDDRDRGVWTSGNWETVVTEGYRTQYLRANTSLVATAAVTWTSEPLAADGLYGLYVWIVSGADRASDAIYAVHHAGGVTQVAVDQRRHGHTWRYIGRFPVRGGERLTVVLTNRSATAGRVVVADAIRLGGGQFGQEDLARNGGPVETEAPVPPDEAWWETAAYYNVQRLGIDPDDFAYFNDVVARPLWARWEHANTGEDAVYVSWHTNGYNGHNTSVWGTISYIHSFQAVAGSAALRHAIHRELINDIRAGWDPAWHDLGEASRDLGELRELWDDDPGNAIPGVLLEIAYHDHAGNTDALKDPRFALLSARAVYQGIVKYFDPGLPLLPEPPTHLIVRNAGLGQISVSWRPSPTDDAGAAGDPAASYRVYTSRDGLGWDNGRAVVGTQATLTGVQENELVFVRVTAVNAGGESFPTPVLAARASYDGLGRILLVDGFDRIDRQGLILQDDPPERINARLLSDQINSFDYVIEHGTALSLPFDSAVNEAVARGDVNLALYSIVDWMSGEESTADHSFDAAEQAAVATYLESGGALFVSGSEIGWDLVTKGNGPAFYQTYLGADMAGHDAGTYVAAPTTEGIFAGLPPLSFRANYDVDFPEQLAPRASSIAALDYVGGNGGTAAVQYDAGGCRRVVYLGFPFEAVDAGQRLQVMERVIDYLGGGGCLSIAPQTVITTPANGEAFKSVPDLGGTTVGFNPIESVEVQVRDPHGRYWDGQRWIAASHWLTAVGTRAWHYPLTAQMSGTTTALNPAMDQGEYGVWARAWDSAALSDTTPAFARFHYDTIPPATPTLLAPADGVSATVPFMGFFWQGPMEDTGSPLGYHLQVGERVLTQTLTHYVPSTPLATGVYTWRVRAFDAAGNRSSWTPSWRLFVEHREMYFPLTFKNAQLGQPSLCEDLINNGGFEWDGGWIINRTVLPAAYTTDRAHAGQRSMRLGIPPPLPGSGSISYSSVDQTIPVPGGTAATLTFWAYALNENGDTDDLQYVGLYDQEGSWKTLWSERLNTADWAMHRIDLTPYLGQVINLRLSVKNDGDDDTTAMYVDDVRLEVCGQ